VQGLDERLGLSELMAEYFPRLAGKEYPAAARLLRQAVDSRLAGYEDVNDAMRLSRDPTFRLIRSEKIGSGRGGSGRGSWRPGKLWKVAR